MAARIGTIDSPDYRPPREGDYIIQRKGKAKRFKADDGNLISPMAFALWTVGGCVALYLIAMSPKKTPINTVQGLPPYEGPPKP